MNHRERILTALRRQAPDRLPWVLGMTAPVLEMFRQRTGAQFPNEYWDFDVCAVGPTRPNRTPLDYAPYYAGRTFRGPVTIAEEWGYAMVEQAEGLHFRHWESPFDQRDFTPDDARRYPLPDYADPGRYEGLQAINDDWHAKGYATQGLSGFSTFDYSWLIRGYELFLMDLAAGEESAAILMDRVSDAVAALMQNLAARGTDIVGVGEDVGTQNALIMSPATWRREIKPRFRKIIAAAKSGNPEVLFFYHSDGQIQDIIPELIEIGVDILNPIQPECMNPAEIKRKYGKDLAFWGAVGTQTVMPHGTPQEVRRTVKRLFKTVGKGGGYLCAPSHTLEPEVPWDNIAAFVDACRECVY
jgi:uroporphyrinogen decarboxylase